MRRLAAAATVFLAACYPGGAEVLTDLDSVTTQHDPAANFSALHTYAMPDVVAELPVSATPALDHSNDPAILAKVAANLDALGWSRVDPSTTTPDVAVIVYASLGPSVLWIPYPFFDAFPGFAGFAAYDSSWRTFYPWARDHELFDGGSVRVDMLDARNPDTANHVLRALWTGAVVGLPSTQQSNLQRIDQGLDQAFAQSPYL